jgi:hypothetical protein
MNSVVKNLSRPLIALSMIWAANHSMRATGITDYLKSGGSLSEARKMANHADSRATQLYDRRDDVASLEEYSRVGI